MMIPIGLPYEQADCWDLVRLVYRNEFWIDLGSRWAQIAGIRDGDWTEVQGGVKTFDVLLFRDGPLNKHVGVVIDPEKGRFLHTMKATGAVVSDYRSKQWKDRLQKIYRHRFLTSKVA